MRMSHMEAPFLVRKYSANHLETELKVTAHMVGENENLQRSTLSARGKSSSTLLSGEGGGRLYEHITPTLRCKFMLGVVFLFSSQVNLRKTLLEL